MEPGTILHCNNVCWLGGTMFNTLTYVRAYPEFCHEIVYLNDLNTDYDMYNQLLDAGASVSHARRLSEDLVRDIDPIVVFLKNIGVRVVDGGEKSGWLLKQPLVYSHHSFVWPPIKCHTRIFNSRFLGRMYNNKLRGMQKNFRYVGSLIDTAPFAAIPRTIDDKRCVIGRVSSDQKVKYPIEALNILKRIQSQEPRVEFFVVGAGKYWNTPKWCRMPAIGSKPVAEFYADMDIMVYRTCDAYVETWGRIVTEAMAAGVSVVAEKKGAIPEQIDHGVNGFLCETDDEFVEHTLHLCRDPELRYGIGMAARKKAVEQFDVMTLRAKTEDIITAAATSKGRV